MTVSISATVGRQGRNVPQDVVIVQRLLQQQGMPVGRADGQCGPRTIGAIQNFQAGFLKYPDGLVEPGGRTLQRLNLITFRPPTTSATAPTLSTPAAIEKQAPAQTKVAVTSLVKVSALGPLNVGLKPVTNAWMKDKVGMPRESFAVDCQPVTDAKLKKWIKTASVGPFKATGLGPVVDSLAAVMQDVAVQQPAVFTALGSAGMLCCRYVRGSTTSISNHSWGTAIDLTLNKVLDKRGDGYTQYGLTLIAPIFNKHGWYWGAAFGTEDAMHFEASRSLLESILPALT